MNLRLLLLFTCCAQREPSLSNRQRVQPAEAVSVGAGWTDRDFGLPLQTAVFSNDADMLGPSVFKDSQSSQENFLFSV